MAYEKPPVTVTFKGKKYRLISTPNRTPKPPTPPGMERKRSSNEALTETEINMLISAADDLFDRTILILGFNTGLRISEISSIETGRIDFDNSRVKVWDEKKDRDRDVYLGDAAITAIRLYMKERKVTGMKLFEFGKKTFERHFQAMTKRVLGGQRSWHTVRHSYVTLCAKRQVDIKVVAENTGDSVRTLWETYNNPSKETMQEAANRILGDIT